MTTLPDITLNELVDAFQSYRECPRPGGWDDLQARLRVVAKQHRISPSGLFAKVHSQYEKRLRRES